MGGGTEALFPTLYPDLMNSVDFKTSLFPVLVQRDEENTLMTYYDYLAAGQKYPWWTVAKARMNHSVVSLFKEDEPDSTFVNPFRLTEKQTDIAKMIDEKVVCKVDKKTMVITIDVTDQDPLIAATMADSVKERLQKFITDYRTNKARVDLEYNRKLYAETKAAYDKARRLYAEFVDANQDVILQSVRQKQVDLENEMQLRFNAYSQISAQLQLAEAKVQENTPAFTTLQSATVPIRKTGPKRMIICLVFLFLAFMGTVTYVFYKEDDLNLLLELLK